MTLKQLYAKLYLPFFRYFRTRRMRRFAQEFALTPDSRVLDVGGTFFNWTLLSVRPDLVILNRSVPRRPAAGAMWIKADALHLPFQDGMFDIVYSNTVIEHVSTFENQRCFAAECRRVGISYYIQTPNRWFFMEPHYITPFIHWLPRFVRWHLLRYGTLWGWMTRPSPAECRASVEEIRLLSEKEVRLLFPDADIWYERFLGMIKSFMALRKMQKSKDSYEYKRL
jgi:hypothetical protein